MSKNSITLDQLISWEPCDPDKHKLLFASSTTLSVSQALDAGATVSDILWVAEKLKLTTECVIFAIRCAEKVAHLNNDPRVQKAIDAAKNYVKNPTADAARAANAAADSAYAALIAADAAHAAYAANAAADVAAYAADVAYAAARAAADVADSAAYAAYAATPAADAEIEKFQKDLLIEIFK